MFATTTDEWVPDGLDTMEPGHVMACLLAHIDMDRCSGHDRVRVIRAQQRMASHYAACTYDTMASVVQVIESDDIGHDFAEEAAAAEVGAALR